MRGTKQQVLKKEVINNKLHEILMYYGCKPGKSHVDNWSCTPARHKDPKGDLSIKGDVCCCHCGISGDAINVISIMEGYSKNKEGFYNSLKKGYEILNEDIEIPEIYKTKLEKPPIKKNVDLTKYIVEEFGKLKKSDYQYFYDRGITRTSIFENILPIVSMPYFLPHENIPQLDNICDYRFIIPIWENGKVVNCILRRDDEKSQHNNKALNLKNLNVKFFNTDLLNNNLPDIICITEGIFDSLSFLQYGISSMCLNSVMMYKRFNMLITDKKNNLKNKVFVLALDNDKRGKEYSLKIKEHLKSLNLKCITLNIEKYKDINEYLVNDKKKFEYSIYKMLKHCEKML